MEGFGTEMTLRIVSYSGKAADTLHSASNGHWMMTDPEEGTWSEVRWPLSSEGKFQ